MGCGASSNATPANEPPVAHITDPTAHHIQMEGDKRNIPFQSIAIWVKHAEELPDAVVQQWKGNQDVSLHCEVTGDTANGGVKGINVLEIGYHKLRAHRVQSDPANPEWNRRFQVCCRLPRGLRRSFVQTCVWQPCSPLQPRGRLSGQLTPGPR